MRKVFNLFLVLFMAVLFNLNVSAEENTDGLELWTLVGTIDSTISFQESVPGTAVQNIEYDVDGNSFIGFGGRYQFVNAGEMDKLSFSFEYSRASSLDGDMDNTRWDAPNYNNASYYYKYTAKAENDYYDINLGWKLYESTAANIKVDYLIGYFKDDYLFTATDPRSIIDNYVSSSSSSVGHRSYYEVDMKGYYTGVAGSITMLNEKLKIDASLKYVPSLRGQGEVSWELSPLISKQDGDGDGYIFNIGATFIPKSNWTIGLHLSKLDLEIDGDTYNYTPEFITDQYGATTHDIDRSTFAGVSDLDHIEFESFKTEIRVGYNF